MSSTSYKGLILSASTAADGVECPGWRTYGKVPPKHCQSPTGERATSSLATIVIEQGEGRDWWEREDTRKINLSKFYLPVLH